jgi:Protein of unknown function (DUF3570)
MTTRDSRIGEAVAAATCTLLGSTAPDDALADDAARWDFDTALLYYGEDGDRVRDLSASVMTRRDFDDDRYLSLDLTVDSLTGASPSGAIASGEPQTFTRPSGDAVYQTPAGEIPLDDSFLDTRFALDVGWTQPFARLYTLAAGLGFSTEYDYTHLGANLGVTRDFNRRNTTLSAAVAWAQDDIDPVGGAPLPLAPMRDVEDDSSKASSDSKDVLDVLVGLTQVLGPSTVLRVNFSFSDSSGYLTDPYKILSVVDPITGDRLPHTPPPGMSGPSGVYLYESRPDSRSKESFYAEVKHDFAGRVLGVSYRYATDDWGIDSHTLDARLRWPIGESNYLEPHLRYYTQPAADFYRFSLVDGEPLPEFASADPRLAELDGVTLGLKYGHRTASGNEWNARLELYQQSGHIPADQIIGNQAQRPQFPDLDAVIVQVGYRFRL